MAMPDPEQRSHKSPLQSRFNRSLNPGTSDQVSSERADFDHFQLTWNLPSGLPNMPRFAV